MRFDRCALVFKLMRSGLEEEKPYWSYEDIGVFSLLLAVLGPILHLFIRFHLLSRSELENPRFGLQFALIDNANRLLQIAQGTSGVRFNYDSDSRPTSLTLPNGFTMSYGYDAASQLSAINYQLGNTTLGNLTYSYDLAGRRTSVRVVLRKQTYRLH